MNGWPAKPILTKIRDLRGVSGPTIAAIDLYFGMPSWWRFAAIVTDAEIEATEESLRKKVSGDRDNAKALLAQLRDIVQAHWSQLLEAKLV